jgi:hypothetical protein
MTGRLHAIYNMVLPVTNSANDRSKLVLFAEAICCDSVSRFHCEYFIRHL